MNDFIPASEYCVKVFDGTHETPKPTLTGFPLITSKNILGGNLDLESAYNISEEDYSNIQKRSAVKQYDILFSMIGSVGEIYLERDAVIPYTIKNVCAFRSKDIDHAKWLYFYLQSPTAKNFIRNYLAGAVQKFLPLGTMRDFPVPKFDENQRGLVNLLFSIENKILENNHQKKLLEKTALEIFNYWFLQYEFPGPNGQPFLSSGGSFIFNESVEMELPHNWSVETFDEKIQIGSGYPFNSSNYSETGKYGVITIKNVQDRRLQLNDLIRYDQIPSNLADHAILGMGDILISLTGNVGRICLVDEINLLLNQRVGKIICEDLFRNYAYLYFLLPETRKRLEMISNGSSQQNLSPVDATKFLHAFPDEQTLVKFNEVIGPLIQKTVAIGRENRELQATEEWLLSMFNSGQIAFKE